MLERGLRAPSLDVIFAMAMALSIPPATLVKMTMEAAKLESERQS
jgi:hypothetical protein